MATTNGEQSTKAGRQSRIAIAIAVVALLCPVIIHVVWRAPPWKASGDGKTIFNTRTGELRITATGYSVAETQAKRELEEKERAERRELEEKERAARNGIRQANDWVLWEKLKDFVDAHPEVIVGGSNWQWANVTKPFRLNRGLSWSEREQLLGFLADAILEEPYKSDATFHQAINDLGRYVGHWS